MFIDEKSFIVLLQDEKGKLIVSSYDINADYFIDIENGSNVEQTGFKAIFMGD